MYDAGIDFTAKAASPHGVQTRTDNMVFYIAQNDQARASDMIKQFLTERGIGQGHIRAAVPSSHDGLSWAMEPTKEAQAIWREVTGSTAKTSFNGFVATMAIPTYLDRLAEAQTRKGNRPAAQAYRQEAQRARDVIARPNSRVGWKSS